MIPLLIAGGLVALGTAIVVANWNDIVDWIRDFVPKLKAAWKKLRPLVPYEMQFLGDMVVEAGERLARIIHKLYYQEENGQWMEETTIRKVDETEVPPHIRAKIQKKQQEMTKQADISQEMELIMSE